MAAPMPIKNVRILSNRNTVFAAGLLAALCHVQVMAQTDGSFPYTTNGNQTTYSKAGMNARFNSHFVWDIDPDGKLRASSTSQAPTSGGKKIPVSTKSILPNLAAAGAIAKHLAKFAGPLGAGVALWDLANELDYNLTRGADGSIEVTENGETSYQYHSAYCSAQSAVGETLQAFVYRCQGPTFARTWSPVNCTITGLNATCTHTDTWGGSRSSDYELRNPVVAAGTPKTIQDLADKIASESGWPSNSKLPDAVRDAAAADIPFDLPAPTVTGPATSDGGTVTTTNNGGDVTTITTTNNHTYEGAKVTTNTTTTTTVAINGGGTTTTTETKEADDPDPDQCEKNPQSVGCADLDTPDGEIPKATETITYSAENVFGDGACPADVMASLGTLGGGSYKVWDWQKLCGYALPIRAMVLLLATFAAFLIVVPGRAET